MSQTGLIDAVTESAHIPKGRRKNTPTPATAILHTDTEGLARQESWNYPSVIGQLNYLAQKSRPDISFAIRHSPMRAILKRTESTARESSQTYHILLAMHNR
jgi:hypothetical protein